MADPAAARPPEPVHRASPAHLRALSHPLSWRVLRLCLDQARTNQQLAQRLDVAPATLLRRVRALTEAGFLVAEAPRRGDQGAWERPYRATGRTWRLELGTAGDETLQAQVELAVLDAHRAEVEEIGPATSPHNRRAVLHLDAEAAAELNARVDDLLTEFRSRETPAGAPVSVLWSTVEGAPSD